MKSIHIRDIDPQVLQRLKKPAELKTIIEEVVKKVPEAAAEEDYDIITVSTGNTES
ncbi:MAG: hypothetical protein ACLFQW_03960 [Spirochaetaceae bacterium]